MRFRVGCPRRCPSRTAAQPSETRAGDEFKNTHKLLLLGGECIVSFFKGWNQVPLYVYVDAEKFAYSSFFV